MYDFSSPWYVARLRPGASRRAPERVRAPEWRKDETVAERSLRDAGFDCYFPRMKKELRHHRTKALILRSFPLFTGYVFVNGISVGPIRAEDCDGIAEVMGIRLDGNPWPVSANLVAAFWRAERNLEFDDTREARQRRREEGRTWRETVQLQFPAGTDVQVRDAIHPMAGFHGQVQSVTGKGMVRVMMNLFGGLVPVEIEARELQAA